MDAFQLLKNDHEKVEKLFEKLSDSSPGAKRTRHNLFSDLKSELEIHSQIEQDLFYPALQEADQTADLVEEALDEHEQVQQMLENLDVMDPEDSEWDDMINELKENVQRHVEFEESELFVKAENILSMEERESLGEQLRDHRDQLKTQT